MDGRWLCDGYVGCNAMVFTVRVDLTGWTGWTGLWVDREQIGVNEYTLFF